MATTTTKPVQDAPATPDPVQDAPDPATPAPADPVQDAPAAPATKPVRTRQRYAAGPDPVQEWYRAYNNAVSAHARLAGATRPDLVARYGAKRIARYTGHLVAAVAALAAAGLPVPVQDAPDPATPGTPHLVPPTPAPVQDAAE